MRDLGQMALPIVGVMGSGRSADEARCRDLGRWLATERVHLLTGGGRGVMEAVSRGFFESRDRVGLVLGVLPSSGVGIGEAPSGYPNRWVEVPIRTHLPKSGAEGTDIASRNHINVLTSHVIIALPGSWGTTSEVTLAVQYGRPVIAYLRDFEAIPELPETVPIASDLAQVRAFVRASICGAP